MVIVWVLVGIVVLLALGPKPSEEQRYQDVPVIIDFSEQLEGAKGVGSLLLWIAAIVFVGIIVAGIATGG